MRFFETQKIVEQAAGQIEVSTQTIGQATIAEMQSAFAESYKITSAYAEFGDSYGYKEDPNEKEVKMKVCIKTTNGVRVNIDVTIPPRKKDARKS